MGQTGERILVHFLDAQQEGFEFERRRKEWPLHMTLVGWFDVPDPTYMDKSLQEYAERQSTFDVTLTKRAFFGPDHNVPVNLIAEQRRARELHEGLLDTVILAGGIVKSGELWTRDDYIPHVTEHGVPEDRHVGDKLTVSNFHAVELLPDNICRIIKQYSFGEAA